MVWWGVFYGGGICPGGGGGVAVCCFQIVIWRGAAGPSHRGAPSAVGAVEDGCIGRGRGLPIFGNRSLVVWCGVFLSTRLGGVFVGCSCGGGFFVVRWSRLCRFVVSSPSFSFLLASWCVCWVGVLGGGLVACVFAFLWGVGRLPSVRKAILTLFKFFSLTPLMFLALLSLAWIPVFHPLAHFIFLVS